MKQEKLRIAILSVHSSPVGELGTNDTGGMSVCTRELAREMGAQGHQVDMFTRLRGSESAPCLDLYENVRLIHLNAGNGKPLSKMELYPHLGNFFQELVRYAYREDRTYDLIHSHYWISGKVGIWAQARWDVPHIISYHTLGAAKNHIAGAEREPKLRVDSEMELAKSCDRILATTKREKGYLEEFYGAQSESIGVVPCGVNLNLFRPMDRLESRIQLGLDQDKSIILYVGRFAPSKGTDRLLEAVAHLKNHPEIKLIVIGGDGDKSPEEENLRGLCRDWGILDRVTFTGRQQQENLPTYYSAADVLAVPSRYESFGLVALESLACGTPVVSTNVGAMESIIQEGETGHIIPNGSPQHLAKGIEAFIMNSRPGSKEAIRESAQEYSWSRVASLMLNEYTSVIDQYQATNALNMVYKVGCCN